MASEVHLIKLSSIYIVHNFFIYGKIKNIQDHAWLFFSWKGITLHSEDLFLFVRQTNIWKEQAVEQKPLILQIY